MSDAYFKEDGNINVITGRYDASFGTFLKGSSSKHFMSIPGRYTGFVVRGDVKDLAVIRSASGEKLVIAAINNDSARVFKIHSR